MSAAPSALWIQSGDGCVFCWIHATPRARRPGIGGLHGDALRVAVAAAPESGAANAACIEALARALEVRRADVQLESGARSRRKRMCIRGEPGRLRERLHALALLPAPGHGPAARFAPGGTSR